MEQAAAPLPAAPICTPGETESLGDGRSAFAASALGPLTAFASPGGERMRRFGRLNVNGVPTVLGVLAVVRGRDCEPLWYRVRLPIRPNGATGWVRARAVDVYAVRTRIEVDLSERRVVLLRGGRPVMAVTAAIGSAVTPTPTGRYYVNQRLRAADPTGPWGPAAIGISAFSPVLTAWTQGGPIAIHGTNRPWLTGEAVSNGCLRVRNDLLLRLYERTSVGTPVLIQA